MDSIIELYSLKSDSSKGDLQEQYLKIFGDSNVDFFFPYIERRFLHWDFSIIIDYIVYLYVDG